MGQLDDESVDLHLQGLYSVLKYLGSIEGEPMVAPSYNYYDNFEWVFSPKRGIFYPSVSLGEQVKQGQELGSLEDYFGNTLATVKSHTTGRIILLTSSPAVEEKGLLMGVCS